LFFSYESVLLIRSSNARYYAIHITASQFLDKTRDASMYNERFPGNSWASCVMIRWSPYSRTILLWYMELLSATPTSLYCEVWT